MRCIVHRDQHIYQCSQEFRILDEYLAYIEGSINVILKDIILKLQSKEEYIECDDDQTVGYYFDGLVLPDSAAMIFSRFLYNNYFLSLWATYETGLKEIAMFLSLALGSDNYNQYMGKKDFITAIFKYFKDIYKIDIPTVNQINQEYLRYLYKLRNVIAHGNGRTEDVSKKNEDLVKWILKQPEITVSEDGWILLNDKFDRSIYEGLSFSFERLCRLAYEHAPDAAPRPVKRFIIHY